MAHLSAFVAVRDVTHSRETPAGVAFAGVGVLRPLNPRGDVVDDDPGLVTLVSGEGVGDCQVLHHPLRTDPVLLPVDSFTRGALNRAIL